MTYIAYEKPIKSLLFVKHCENVVKLSYNIYTGGIFIKTKQNSDDVFDYYMYTISLTDEFIF